MKKLRTIKKMQTLLDGSILIAKNKLEFTRFEVEDYYVEDFEPRNRKNIIQIEVVLHLTIDEDENKYKLETFKRKNNELIPFEVSFEFIDLIYDEMGLGKFAFLNPNFN
jgi:hypothetical protein